MALLSSESFSEVLRNKCGGSPPLRVNFQITDLLPRRPNDSKLVFNTYHVRRITNERETTTSSATSSTGEVEFATPRKFSLGDQIQTTFLPNTLILVSLKATEPYTDGLFGSFYLTKTIIEKFIGDKNLEPSLFLNPACSAQLKIEFADNTNDESSSKGLEATVTHERNLRKAIKANKTVRKCNHKFKKPAKDRGRRCAVCGIINDEGIYSCLECKLAVHGSCMHSVVNTCLASLGATRAGAFFEATSAKNDRGAQFNSPHFFIEAKRKAFSSKIECHHCSSSISSGKYNTCEACKNNYHLKCSALTANDCGISKELIDAILGEDKDEPGVIASRQVNDKIIKDDATSQPLNLNMQYSNFRYLKIIGEGSFGIVYQALYLPKREAMALKSISMIIKDDDDILSLQNEIDVMKALRDHPFIIETCGIFKAKGSIFIAMEICASGNLFDYVDKNGSLDSRKLEKVAAQLIDGVCYMHSKEIIHRDIKSENLLINCDGVIKLCDFGLSKYLRNDAQCYTYCGTVPYMSPEIIREKSYGFPSDFWAIGITLYELHFNLKLPFKEEEADIIKSVGSTKPLSMARFGSDRDSPLCSLVSKLVEKNEAKRLGSPNSPHGAIQDHVFFRNIGWSTLLKQKGPFPQITSYSAIELGKKASKLRSVRIKTINVNVAEKDARIFNKFDYCAPKYA
ncbi:MAG: hypothetical protein MHMPM18_001052 [Marteilia pararefringens]